MKRLIIQTTCTISLFLTMSNKPAFAQSAIEIQGSPIVVGHMAVLDEKVLFNAVGSNFLNVLHGYDGTAISQIATVYAEQIRALKPGLALFTSSFNKDFPTYLWVTDGTTAGTKAIKQIKPGAGQFDLAFYSNFAVTKGGKAYFIADNGTTGAELWITDGTEAGTKLVKDIESGSSSPFDANYQNSSVHIWGEKALFLITSGTAKGLWISDGTETGTVRILEDIGHVNYSAQASVERNGKLYVDRYITNGTASGTKRLPSSGRYPFVFNNELYCYSSFGIGKIVNDSVEEVPLGGSYNVSEHRIVNGKLFLRASSGMYLTDLTAAGMVRITGIRETNNPGMGTEGASVYSNEFGGKLYFGAVDSAKGMGNELYVCNGTTAGVSQHTDMPNNGNSSEPAPHNFTPFRGALLFIGVKKSNTNQKTIYRIGDVKADIASGKLVPSSAVVFPNPSQGLFNIESLSSTTRIAVYNLLGEKVLEQQGMGTIDLSQQAKGLYLVQVMEANVLSTAKLIVE